MREPCGCCGGSEADVAVAVLQGQAQGQQYLCPHRRYKLTFKATLGLPGVVQAEQVAPKPQPVCGQAVPQRGPSFGQPRAAMASREVTWHWLDVAGAEPSSPRSPQAGVKPGLAGCSARASGLGQSSLLPLPQSLLPAASSKLLLG